MLTDRAPSFNPFTVTVDSTSTCPVSVAHDLSGSSFRIFPLRAERVLRTVALARIIHDGSSAPLPHPPPYYGGG